MDSNFRTPFLGLIALYFATFMGSRLIREPHTQTFVASVGLVVFGLACFVLEYLSESGTFNLMVGWLLLMVLGFIGIVLSLGLASSFQTLIGILVIGILLAEVYIFYESSGVYTDTNGEEES